MKDLLREAREKKSLKTREVAQLLGIDQALVSKFESGNRKPTREQVGKLASLLEIDYDTLMFQFFWYYKLPSYRTLTRQDSYDMDSKVFGALQSHMIKKQRHTGPSDAQISD